MRVVEAMTRVYKILSLVGDGIAHEIVPEAIKVLEAAEEAFDMSLEILGPYEFGAKYWVDHDMKRGWDSSITEELIFEVDGIFKGSCRST